MEKPKTTSPEPFVLSRSLEERIWREICNYKHKDLVKACVLRGIDYFLIIKYDHQSLLNWFYKNYENSQDHSRLAEFDLWRDQLLQAEGFSSVHPHLKLGYVEPILEFSESTPKAKKTSGSVETKVASKTQTVEKAIDPQECNTQKIKIEEWGITTGTKKYLTYYCCIMEKLSKEDTLKKVLSKYPDADSKSIGIWWKRAENLRK